MVRDLTTGAPSRVLWKFCLPLFGSVIFQQLYNIADSLVAGKFIGEQALAAVGNSYEITLLFIAFAFGCNMGCSVVASQLFGAKEYTRMKTAVYTSLITTGITCGTLTLLGFLTGAPLLRLINTPEAAMADSLLYLNIYVGGLVFLFFYNVSTGIFSALGDSRTPFLFLAFSSLANIGVDILFVAVFHMGVAGVAWATFLCQGISAVLAVVTVFRRLAEVPTEGKIPLFDTELLRRFVVIAVPSALQQGFISISNIIIQSFVNSFGLGVMAGFSAATKLNNLVITSLTTLGNGVSNFTAQNLGAGKIERVREGTRAGIKMVWMLCIPFVLVYCFLGEPVIRFFIADISPEALHAGMMFLRIVSPFYIMVSIKLVLDGILRGSSDMNHFMIDTFTDLFMRAFLAGTLSATALGSTGIWMSWPIGWSIGTGLSILFYKQGTWLKTLKK